MLVGLITLFLLIWPIATLAYIPASATNDTNTAIRGGLNVTDVSQLHLQWYINGSYWDRISYQLAGKDSQGISRGALVHFSEEKVDETTPPTTTPWIALVACDANATKASQVIDIFTLARDKGAQAALLYSLYSTACVINPEYADPTTFDQVFDIFSTQSLTSAHLIEYQFGQIGVSNETLYGSYDSQRLNDSAEIINATIKNKVPVAPSYLFATLKAYNATGDLDDGPASGSSVGASSSDPSPSTNTSLAMIILYAITGCVSALFCVVIISGAIRAIRHPERYGPRSGRGVGGGYSQSRVRGLTRAMLDTFPVVKFGSTPGDHTSQENQRNPNKDLEANGSFDSDGPGENHANNKIELQNMGKDSKGNDVDTKDGVADTTPDALPPSDQDNEQTAIPTKPGTSSSSSSQSSRGVVAESSSRPNSAPAGIDNFPAGSSSPVRRPSQRNEVVPESIGRETCPICIVDFEEGDDLRVLPCEGKHRFHQQCVDPWLLELSSSCPICRQDFLALETILSGESEENVPHGHRSSPDHHGHSESPSNNGRFSRYLRFARRRRREHEDDDPTDPYLPMAAHTSMYHSSS